MKPPDLVLFLTDQQRADQVGFSSGGLFDTPHLDALASAGVVFDAACTAAPVCVPARNALLTGLDPHRVPTQVNRFAMREGFWTVARQLRAAGYETALVGKMHFAPVHADHGFDTMRLCEHLHAQGLGEPTGSEPRDDVDEYHAWLLEHGYDDWRYRADGTLHPNAPAGVFPYPAEAHPTGWVRRQALDLLASRSGDRPLFLVVSFPGPHAPLNPPEEYAARYDPADSPMPRTGFEVNERLPQPFRDAMSTFGGKATPRLLPEGIDGYRREVALVRALVAQIDDAIGAITARLDLTATRVWFTSDHGDYAGNRGLLRKFPWIPYDDLARVPLVVAGAGVAGGRRIGTVVRSNDFALTALDAAGVAPPGGVDLGSRSLDPILADAAHPGDPDATAFCATNMGWPMVRRGDHKLVLARAAGVPLLFDLAADPDESVDRSADPALAGVLADLRAALDARLALGVPTLPADL